MTPWLDEATLIHAAAVAGGTDPDALVDMVDVAGLASVVAAAERAPSALHAAAVVVTELGRRRPFRGGDSSTAWLTAALLLDGEDRRLRIGPVAASAVFAAGDRLGVDGVASIIEEHSERRRSRFRRALRHLTERRRSDGPGVVPCPSCGRLLVHRSHDVGSSSLWASTAWAERTARCAVVHGAHDRRGRTSAPLPEPEDTWERVAEGPGGSALLIGSGGAAVVRPGRNGDEAVRLPDVHASELVGDWDGLFRRGEPLDASAAPT